MAAALAIFRSIFAIRGAAPLAGTYASVPLIEALEDHHTKGRQDAAQQGNASLLQEAWDDAKNFLQRWHLEHGLDKADNCPLPEGATWCEFEMEGVPPFTLAVRGRADACGAAAQSLAGLDMGEPGQALDVGPGEGLASFALAKAGWTVAVAQPEHAQMDLLGASLCKNPDVARSMDVTLVGLGASERNDSKTGFRVMRLRDFLKEKRLARVDFLRISTQGFGEDCGVLAGAPGLLAAIRPRMVATQVGLPMKGCEPKGYLAAFSEANYDVKGEVGCRDADRTKASLRDYWSCPRVSFLEGAARAPHFLLLAPAP